MSHALGDPLPSLSLPATGAQTIALDSLAARIVVLYFYPKDSTPGCTQEGRDFAALYPQFKQEGAQIFGVSKDSLRRHENFKSKQEFPFDLLADEDEALCQALDVIQEKKLYGKTYLGIVRSTFVYLEGRLNKVWSPVKVKGHAQEVLDYVSTL